MNTNLAGMARRPFIAVYMMTNRRHGTIYTGVTANLMARVAQHREGTMPGFTQKYGLTRLVWFEQHESIVHAIQREKSLKKYKRDWKINLIERENPGWLDLFVQLF
jgi:putative endonuclease